MILTIRHKGLRALWEKGDAKRLNPEWAPKLRRILHALEMAQTPADLDFPGWRLHPLKGNYKGYYAVDVSGNWRLVFRFEGADTTDIDLLDYH